MHQRECSTLFPWSFPVSDVADVFKVDRCPPGDLQSERFEFGVALCLYVQLLREAAYVREAASATPCTLHPKPQTPKP